MSFFNNSSQTNILLDAITAAVCNNILSKNPIVQEITNNSFQIFKKNAPFISNNIRNDMSVKDLGIIGGCGLCKKTFLKHIEMIHHIVDHYPKQFYLFEDTITTTSLMDNDSLENINKNADATSNDEKGKMMYNKNDFSFQIKKENNDLGYAMCSICCQTFNTNLEYESHINLHSLESNLKELEEFSQEKNKLNDNNDNSTCLTNSNYLFSRNYSTVSTKKCNICHKKFISTFDHNLHMGQHIGFSYDCKDCGKCFENRKMLSFHNKSHKNAILPFENNDKDLLNNKKNVKNINKHISYYNINIPQKLFQHKFKMSMHNNNNGKSINKNQTKEHCLQSNFTSQKEKKVQLKQSSIIKIYKTKL